jgi:hypothetical protein
MWNEDALRALVTEVLQTCSKPYGGDITDQVCNKICENEAWLKRFNMATFGRRNAAADLGQMVRDVTRMRATGRKRQASCPIIKGTYTVLE